MAPSAAVVQCIAHTTDGIRASGRCHENSVSPAVLRARAACTTLHFVKAGSQQGQLQAECLHRTLAKHRQTTPRGWNTAGVKGAASASAYKKTGQGPRQRYMSSGGGGGGGGVIGRGHKRQEVCHSSAGRPLLLLLFTLHVSSSLRGRNNRPCILMVRAPGLGLHMAQQHIRN
jgi:hypothetical protein